MLRAVEGADKCWEGVSIGCSVDMEGRHIQSASALSAL
jgi:hypothetical protein